MCSIPNNFIFNTIIHSVKGTRAAQGRGLLNEVAVRAYKKYILCGCVFELLRLEREDWIAPVHIWHQYSICWFDVALVKMSITKGVIFSGVVKGTGHFFQQL